MKLVVVGGGGFRVPLLVQALAHSPFTVHLVDDDAGRLSVIRHVIAGLDCPTPEFHTDLEGALPGADFVFTAIRVGGTEGRAGDEEIALAHGLLGQETVGVGGMAYALRTIPAARHVARTIAALAPNAWTVNFTNPAGVVTQAMREELGDRVVGICDTPISLVNRIAAGRPVDSIDYVGLNHLGWLRSLTSNGTDLVADLLHPGPSQPSSCTRSQHSHPAEPSCCAQSQHPHPADGSCDSAQDDHAPAHDDYAPTEDDQHPTRTDPLDSLEEARVFGSDLLHSIGAIPNEYLFYYWFTREAIARITGRESRGAYLAEQQSRFYRAAAAQPSRATALWRAALADREETYGSESREDASSRRTEEEIAVGGYQEVALTLMHALSGGPAALMILNVRNEEHGVRAIPQLPDDAVVEIPCRVSRHGIHRETVAPIGSELAGLMVQVKASDELLLAATAQGDPLLALRAFAAHPLVDSLTVARELLRDYIAKQPLVARVFRS